MLTKEEYNHVRPKPPYPVRTPQSLRFDVQRITALGFGLVILIMLFAIVGSYRSTGQHNEHLSQLVREAGLKTVLAYTMREAVQERVDSLHAMVAMSDVFERDAEKMRYFGYASNYSQARQSLISYMDMPAERLVIKQLDDMAKTVGPPNTRALDALFDHNMAEPEKLGAVQASIDGHLRLLRQLDAAVRTIHQTTQNRINEAGAKTRSALLTQSILGFLAFVLAVMTATLVVINTGARNRQLSHQAAHDVLTGLLNRQAFESALIMTIEQSQLSPDSHALLYLDLDRFKVVNDSCGHTAGDAMLKQLTEILVDNLRSSDLVGRLGGDEFGILLRFTEPGDAGRVAEKVRRMIAEFTFCWEHKPFQVGASIGMVTFGNEPITAEALLQAADACCYSAKEEGRNRVHQADAQAEQVQRRSGEMRWIHRINTALRENRFVLFGQVIHPMHEGVEDGRLSLEVLLRMRDEQGLGLIPPGQFLPAAERYGIVPEIDCWVVKHSLDWLSKLGPAAENVRISINICGPAASDPQFHQYVKEQISLSDVPPTSLCFEITESAAINSLANAAALVEALKDLGCQFALDDFGSGLSSFSQLRHLQVDYLKIDGGFIHNIDRDSINHAMVESIHNIGKQLGKRTVAEFVENERIRRILSTIGVDFAQGFGLHKPEALDSIRDSILEAQKSRRPARELIVA